MLFHCTAFPGDVLLCFQEAFYFEDTVAFLEDEDDDLDNEEDDFDDDTYGIRSKKRKAGKLPKKNKVRNYCIS